MCRFCCKSLFALVIKISFGCTRDFRIKIWGTSSPEDKLAGDLGNVIEATSSVGFFYSRKISSGQFGTFATISALTAVRCGAQNSVVIGATADITGLEAAGGSIGKEPLSDSECPK